MIKAFESEKIIDFNPVADGEYLYAVDSLLANSLYVQILKYRPFWKQAPGPAGFNLLISQHVRSCDYYKQQSTPRCIFNHLPTSGIMMNRLELYRLMRFTHKNNAFKAVRLQYDLVGERVKVINHIEYLSHMCMKKDPADFRYNIAPEVLGVKDTIRNQRQQVKELTTASPTSSLPPIRSKSIGGSKMPVKANLQKNYVYQPERPGNQSALEQEAENDYIWGKIDVRRYYDQVVRSRSISHSNQQESPQSSLSLQQDSPRSSTESTGPMSPLQPLQKKDFPAAQAKSKLTQSSQNGGSSDEEEQIYESNPQPIEPAQSTALPVTQSLAYLDPLTLRLPAKKGVQTSLEDWGLGKSRYQNPQRMFTRRPPKPLTVPIKQQKATAPIPEEFSQIDWRQNMSNQWAIIDTRSGKTREVIVHPSQLPRPEDSDGLILVKLMEHNLRFYGRKILFKLYALVRQNGDTYIYADPVIELEKVQKKKNQYVSPERDLNFTRKRDADYLTPDALKTLIRQSGFPELSYEKIIMPQTRESVIMVIESLKQKICQAPSQNCFELFEFTFEIATGAEKFRTEIVGIESTPAMPIDNAITFCVYPQLLDDMYSLVLDPYFPPPADFVPKKPQRVMGQPRNDETIFDLVARTKVSERVFFDLRWYGERPAPRFERYLAKWSRARGFETATSLGEV